MCRRPTPPLNAAMLIDATMKHPMPPLALPKREFMENARMLWEKLGLPALTPQTPWYGFRSATGRMNGTTTPCRPRRASGCRVMAPIGNAADAMSSRIAPVRPVEENDDD